MRRGTLSPTSSKRFIYSQTEHKMRGFILALLCNTCSQECAWERECEGPRQRERERLFIRLLIKPLTCSCACCRPDSPLTLCETTLLCSTLTHLRAVVFFLSKGFERWRLRTSDYLRQHRDSGLCWDVTDAGFSMLIFGQTHCQGWNKKSGNKSICKISL